MTIVIAAGGTGGHLYPAVALAREFLRRDPANKVLFVGTSRGLESKVLAHEGFELLLIHAKPVMGKGLLDMVKGLSVMPISLWQCWQIVRQRRPGLVIGVGGYTSPMMVMAAAFAGVPRVILDADPQRILGTGGTCIDSGEPARPPAPADFWRESRRQGHQQRRD